MDSSDEKALKDLGEILERFGKALIATGRRLTKTYQGGQMSIPQRYPQARKGHDEFGNRICAGCSNKVFSESEFCGQCTKE